MDSIKVTSETGKKLIKFFVDLETEIFSALDLFDKRIVRLEEKVDKLEKGVLNEG